MLIVILIMHFQLPINIKKIEIIINMRWMDGWMDNKLGHTVVI